MDVAARHQVGLCLSNEMLHEAGRDGPLFEAGVVTGPVDTNVHGRSAALTFGSSKAIDYPRVFGWARTLHHTHLKVG
jgi:hypothetical protein